MQWSTCREQVPNNATRICNVTRAKEGHIPIFLVSVCVCCVDRKLGEEPENRLDVFPKVSKKQVEFFSLPDDDDDQFHGGFSHREEDVVEGFADVTEATDDNAESDGEDDETQNVHPVLLLHPEVVRYIRCEWTTEQLPTASRGFSPKRFHFFLEMPNHTEQSTKAKPYPHLKTKNSYEITSHR